jgi:hypothetical protein
VRDGEPQIYASLATMRNGYLQGQWQRVQMFLAFNTVAIPLVLGAATTTSNKIQLVIDVAAVIAHLAMMQAMLRGGYMARILRCTNDRPRRARCQ